jgi:isoquinoline 1-oxidoreductase alpha subunit
MSMTLKINGTEHELSVDPQMPLLWVLRDVLKMTGTKYGCGRALCGACTVHMDGQPIRACVTPVAAVAGKAITTIEGLGGDHPLQEAWARHNVPQCGYCQSGQLMSAAALLAVNPDPSDDAIVEAMNGNICRCGTYRRIHAAIRDAAQAMAADGGTPS